jgi:hypothetical protein
MLCCTERVCSSNSRDVELMAHCAKIIVSFYSVTINPLSIISVDCYVVSRVVLASQLTERAGVLLLFLYITNQRVLVRLSGERL